MKIACDNCYGVMYAKAFLHLGHEFCGWRCKEDWIDKRYQILFGDTIAQLHLPLEGTHAAHQIAAPAQGNKA